MLTLTSIAIGIIAIGFAIFMNYPAPPQSPLQYQWHHGGKFHQFGPNKYKIFYKVEDGMVNNSLTVVCLHGFPTSSFDWYKVWPGLKRIFERVIVLDFLGMGYSDKPRRHHYSIFEQASIVEEVLRTIGVKRFHLLAHNYGDSVAQELLARQIKADKASDQALEIQSVCLLNGGIFPSKHFPTVVQKILRTPIVGTIFSKFSNLYFFIIGLSAVFGPETQPSYAEMRDFWGIVRRQDGYRVLGLILHYIDERVENEDQWVGSLQKTEVPVHMIYGPADPVNPPPFATYYRDIIPKPSITELPSHIGHYPQLEAPELVIKSYTEFLNNL